MKIIEICIKRKEDLDKVIKKRKRDKFGTKYEVEISAPIDQTFLTDLAASKLGMNMVSLNCHSEYKGLKPPVIDFTLVNFPALESIEIFWQAIHSVHFTKDNTPNLKSLEIELSCSSSAKPLEYFFLDVPKLEQLSCSFITFESMTEFGKSLSRSPMLGSIYCYKTWGLQSSKSEPHLLVLPKCKSLELYCNDMDYLQVWAPKLMELNIGGCFLLEEVNVLDNKPVGYNSCKYSFKGISNKYKVNIISSSRPKGNVLTHKRCRAIFPVRDDMMTIQNTDLYDWSIL